MATLFFKRISVTPNRVTSVTLHLADRPEPEAEREEAFERERAYVIPPLAAWAALERAS